ncbi:hypothetical protein RI054_02g10500 [Pseudoscourfieldia marina]
MVTTPSSSQNPPPGYYSPYRDFVLDASSRDATLVSYFPLSREESGGSASADTQAVDVARGYDDPIVKGELLQGARYVDDDVTKTAVLQCSDETNDFARLSGVGPYGRGTGAFAVNLWMRTPKPFTIKSGATFEYLYSHTGDDDMVGGRSTRLGAFGPNQVHIYIPEAAHPAHGVVRAIVKDDDDDSGRVTYLDSDGKFTSNQPRDTPGHVDVLDGNWHMLTLSTHATGGDGFEIYVDGKLGATIPRPEDRQQLGVKMDGGGPIKLNDTVYLCGRNDEHPERHFGGRLAHVAMFDGALTSDDVERLFNSGKKLFGVELPPPKPTGMDAFKPQDWEVTTRSASTTNTRDERAASVSGAFAAPEDPPTTTRDERAAAAAAAAASAATDRDSPPPSSSSSSSSVNNDTFGMASGRPCIYPFTFGGTTYTSGCTELVPGRKMCRVQNEDGTFAFEGCLQINRGTTTTIEEDNDDDDDDDGDGRYTIDGARCVFPLVFRGKTVYDCVFIGGKERCLASTSGEWQECAPSPSLPLPEEEEEQQQGGRRTRRQRQQRWESQAEKLRSRCYDEGDQKACEQLSLQGGRDRQRGRGLDRNGPGGALTVSEVEEQQIGGVEATERQFVSPNDVCMYRKFSGAKCGRIASATLALVPEMYYPLSDGLDLSDETKEFLSMGGEDAVGNLVNARFVEDPVFGHAILCDDDDANLAQTPSYVRFDDPPSYGTSGSFAVNVWIKHAPKDVEVNADAGTAYYVPSRRYQASGEDVFFEYVFSHSRDSTTMELHADEDEEDYEEEDYEEFSGGTGTTSNPPLLSRSSIPNFFGPNNVHIYFPESEHPTHGVVRTIVQDSAVQELVPGSGRYSEMWLDSDGRVSRNTVRDENSLDEVAGSPKTDLYDGLWHMITITTTEDNDDKSGGYSIYVDGKYVATNIMAHTNPAIPFDFRNPKKNNHNEPMLLCGRSDLHPLRHFHGRVAQLSVYDHSLEPADMLLLYHSVPLSSDTSLMPPPPLPPPPPPLPATTSTRDDRADTIAMQQQQIMTISSSDTTTTRDERAAAVAAEASEQQQQPITSSPSSSTTRDDRVSSAADLTSSPSMMAGFSGRPCAYPFMVGGVVYSTGCANVNGQPMCRVQGGGMELCQAPSASITTTRDERAASVAGAVTRTRDERAASVAAAVEPTSFGHSGRPCAYPFEIAGITITSGCADVNGQSMCRVEGGDFEVCRTGAAPQPAMDSASMNELDVSEKIISPRHEVPRPVAYFPLSHPQRRRRGSRRTSARIVESIPIPGMAKYSVTGSNDDDDRGRLSRLLNASGVFVGEIYGNVSFVPDAAFGRAMQCHENSEDYVRIQMRNQEGDVLSYGERDGQFAVNLWFKHKGTQGNTFEYLFSHGGVVESALEMLGDPGRATFGFGKDQIQIYVPESSHPSHGVVRAIVKDGSDVDGSTSFVDSDGRYNDNGARDLPGHIDTDDGRWHQITVTTIPRSDGNLNAPPEEKGFQVYIDGVLGGVVSASERDRVMATRQRQQQGRRRRRSRHLLQSEDDYYSQDWSSYEEDYKEVNLGNSNDYYDPISSGPGGGIGGSMSYLDAGYDSAWNAREEDRTETSSNNPFGQLPYSVDGGDRFSTGSSKDVPIQLCGRSDGHPERHFGGRLARLTIYDQSLRPDDVMRLYLSAPLHLEANLRRQEQDEIAMQATQAEQLEANPESRDATGTLALPPREVCKPAVAEEALEHCVISSQLDLAGTNAVFEASCCQKLYDTYVSKSSEAAGCMCYVTHSSVVMPAEWMVQVTSEIPPPAGETVQSLRAFCESRVDTMLQESAARGEPIGATRRRQLVLLCASTRLLESKIELCESKYGFDGMLQYNLGGPFVERPRKTSDCFYDAGAIVRGGGGSAAAARPPSGVQYNAETTTYGGYQGVEMTRSGDALTISDAPSPPPLSSNGDGSKLGLGWILAIGIGAAALALAAAFYCRKCRTYYSRRGQARRFVEMEGFAGSSAWVPSPSPAAAPPSYAQQHRDASGIPRSQTASGEESAARLGGGVALPPQNSDKPPLPPPLPNNSASSLNPTARQYQPQRHESQESLDLGSPTTGTGGGTNHHEGGEVDGLSLDTSMMNVRTRRGRQIEE